MYRSVWSHIWLNGGNFISRKKFSQIFDNVCCTMRLNDTRVIFSDSVCPEKTNCESDSGLLSSGGKTPLILKGTTRGHSSLWLGLLRVFKCVDDLLLFRSWESTGKSWTFRYFSMSSHWIDRYPQKSSNKCTRKYKLSIYRLLKNS